MAKTLNILVIEDDPSINEVVAEHLRREGHRCVQAFSGSEGLLLCEGHCFDAVITDLMLPGATGEEVVSALAAAQPEVPLIVISARITPADKVALLNLGASDYLTKPFDLDELSARIDAQLRIRGQRAGATRGVGAERKTERTDGRAAGIPNGVNERWTHPGGIVDADASIGARSFAASHPETPVEEPLRFKEWLLFPEARVFTVGDQPLALTRTEFNILELLMRRPAKVFTKQELFELAWGEPYSVEDSTISVHVSNLRRKLKPTGTEGYLQTVWGLGFKLA